MRWAFKCSSWLCFLTLNIQPDPIAFCPSGRSTNSQVPFSTRVLYSSKAASLQRSDCGPCIACLKVRGSSPETEFGCWSSAASSLSSDQMTGGSASGSTGCFIFYSPGGCEMCCVRRGGSGAGGWTGGKIGSGKSTDGSSGSSGAEGSSGTGIGGRVAVVRSSTSPSPPRLSSRSRVVLDRRGMLGARENVLIKFSTFRDDILLCGGIIECPVLVTTGITNTHCSIWGWREQCLSFWMPGIPKHEGERHLVCTWTRPHGESCSWERM